MSVGEVFICDEGHQEKRDVFFKYRAACNYRQAAIQNIAAFDYRQGAVIQQSAV